MTQEARDFIYKSVSKVMETPQVDLCDETDFVMELGTGTDEMNDIVLEVEEEFDITITEDEIDELDTIQDLINLTIEKLQ